jgi:hypothetical protein
MNQAGLVDQPPGSHGCLRLPKIVLIEQRLPGPTRYDPQVENQPQNKKEKRGPITPENAPAQPLAIEGTIPETRHTGCSARQC